MDGEWIYCEDYRCAGRVVETQALWGETYSRVWLPGRDAIVRIPSARLKSLSEAPAPTPAALAAVAASARVAEALTQDLLLAPTTATVIPLPHQLRALARAVSGDRVRYLLADEVGLGKTIEAGLILRELKLRGRVKRTLIVAPAGLVRQWQMEMSTHFGETFVEMNPGTFAPYHLTYPEENVWQGRDQYICPLDAVKPLDRRKGWSAERLDDHNRWRYHDLISAGWDLVIVDEAHRLGGSTERVARHQLGRGLAEASPYLLLLSATPHPGKTDAFHRLLTLLDARAFPDADSLTQERLRPYVIRTEKRRAIDADGRPLFQLRRTELAPITWQERQRAQKELYHAVTEYVRHGYDKAVRERRSHVTFLLILLQRLVVSSTRAIRATLEKRLALLTAPPPEETPSLFPLPEEEEWADLDGQEQLDLLLARPTSLRQDERAQVEGLLAAATRCEREGPDAKAEALLEWLYRLQAEAGEPEAKVLLFTEFVATQEMLREFLEGRGFSVACLNGSLDLKERARVQAAFARDVRILLSTDAGGEGLNLQFCHLVINYDLPWNPMRLEQRIGRVDRIGQTREVRAVNFVFADSVEHRVREVLERKLAVILAEFGVDKTGDVLDSSQTGPWFDELHLNALLHPDQVEAQVEHSLEQWKQQATVAHQAGRWLESSDPLDPAEARRMREHLLPHWLERMTSCHVTAHGGSALRGPHGWRLAWPDGEIYENAVFTQREADACPTARPVTLEDPKIRQLATRLPRFVPGQPIPVVTIPGLSDSVQGDWSLWRVGVADETGGRFRLLPLFRTDDGRVFPPTARQIWEQLLAVEAQVQAPLPTDLSREKLALLTPLAEVHGHPLYEELTRARRLEATREKEKNDYAFAARRRVLERIGLATVRNFRLQRLAREERDAHEEAERHARLQPELTPILVLRVEGGDHV